MPGEYKRARDIPRDDAAECASSGHAYMSVDVSETGEPVRYECRCVQPRDLVPIPALNKNIAGCSHRYQVVIGMGSVIRLNCAVCSGGWKTP